MTRRRFSPLRILALRRGGSTAAVFVALCLAASCTSVTPSDESSGGGGATGASTEDSYGVPAQDSEVKDGGQLVMALSAEPDALDPTTSRSLYSRYVFDAMCQKLYDVDEKAQIVPLLATALPTVSEDGLTVTIPVRDDIKFADGTPFNADAVKATFERNLTLSGSGRKSELGPITSVETTDAATVVVHLKEPFSPLTAALADRAGMILSPTATKALGAEFSSKPVCVGPFKFDNRVPSNSIDLVKDPNYYDADKVHLDSISYHIITDSNIRSANLRSGDVQVADTLSTQAVTDLRGEGSLSVLQSPSLGYQGVTFNVGNVDGVGTPAKPIDTPIAQEPKIRQAFELAIDREALAKTVFNGLYSVACSPIAPQSEFSTPEAQKCTSHDPAGAKKLLTEAGVEMPVSITMLASNNPDTLRLSQAIQSMVKEGGFDLKIQPVEYASLLDQQDQGDFELLQLGWSGRIDPDGNIANFVGTGGSQNVSGYNNPEVDDLLVQARQSQDVAERADLYAKVIDILHADDPLVYLYRLSNLTGVANTVKGVQVFPDGVVRLAFAGFAK